MNRHNETVVASVFALISGTLSIGVMSLAAYLSKTPMVFASLGPTAFLCFYSPRSGSASPKNALMGHFIACVVGYASLRIFGIEEAITYDRMHWQYIFTAAFSLGLTSALMLLLRCARFAARGGPPVFFDACRRHADRACLPAQPPRGHPLSHLAPIGGLTPVLSLCGACKICW